MFQAFRLKSAGEKLTRRKKGGDLTAEARLFVYVQKRAKKCTNKCDARVKLLFCF